LLYRPVSVRMSPVLKDFIFSVAEKQSPIPNESVRLFWPGEPKAFAESRREALLRSLDEAGGCVLMAHINRALSTEKQVAKKLMKLHGSLARAKKDLEDAMGDDLTMLKLLEHADRISETANGHPMFPPRQVPSSKGEGIIIHQSGEFLSYLRTAVEQSTRIVRAATIPSVRNGEGPSQVGRSKAESVIIAAMNEDDPKNAALRMIYFAWVHALGRKATATVDYNTGKDRGPFLEFATELAKPLRFKMSAGNVRSRLRRMGYMP
jgi:hypothetical protein